MSCDQIRFWLRELSTNPIYNWCQNKNNLGRALGFNAKRPGDRMAAKLTGAWIYPTEQVRLSERLKLVIAGHLVPVYTGKHPSFEYVNPPRPVCKPPAKLTVRTAATGAQLTVQQFQTPAQQLPDFRTVFQTARLWKE